MRTYVEGALRWVRRIGHRGQNTVEYLLMLVMLAGAVVIVGKLIKENAPKWFNVMNQKITTGMAE